MSFVIYCCVLWFVVEYCAVVICSSGPTYTYLCEVEIIINKFRCDVNTTHFVKKLLRLSFLFWDLSVISLCSALCRVGGGGGGCLSVRADNVQLLHERGWPWLRFYNQAGALGEKHIKKSAQTAKRIHSLSKNWSLMSWMMTSKPFLCGCASVFSFHYIVI